MWQLILDQFPYIACVQWLAMALLAACLVHIIRAKQRARPSDPVALLPDLTERQRSQDHLRYAALHDGLTELPNRRYFFDLVAQAIEHSWGDRRLAVMFLDLDRFKIINDSLGHHAGDQLLIEVSRRLRFWTRDIDVVAEQMSHADIARLSGDEFCILIHGVTPQADVISIAQRLLDHLLEPYSLNALQLHLGGSIGVVIGDITHAKPEDLIRDADTAMYRAKTAGGARCVLFDKEMHSQAILRLQLENDLRQAIARREFVVVYQPIVALESGLIEGFEALVRWKHPEKGMIAPDCFIPVAEETGLIVPIGRFVLNESLKDLAALRSQFPWMTELSVSVNLSKRQLVEEGLIPTIEQALKLSGVAPRHLRLEVTESAVMEHAETVTPVLTQLKAMGLSLSMDDFGTGHSSLSCLHKFPVDCLKIDRAFIHTMGLNRKYAAIVHAIVTLAHNFGMTVVAEGIETADQLVLLQSLECNLGQGYYFSKPVLSNALPALLSGSTWTKKSA